MPDKLSNRTTLLAAAWSRPDLSPRRREFLFALEQQAARRPLTPRQVEALERLASAPPRQPRRAR
jgi:hypothetical protein